MTDQSPSGTPNLNRCANCGLLLEAPPVIHAVVECEDCGKTAFRPPGPEGLKIEAGETVTIPAGALSVSLNKVESRSKLTKHGINWFMGMLLVDNSNPSTADELRAAVTGLRDQADAFLDASPVLADFDLEDQERSEEWINLLMQDRSLPEWSALAIVVLADKWLADDSEAEREVLLWKLATHRALFLFRTNLHELVWRGYTTVGVDQLRAARTAWDDRTGEEDEEHWQRLLDANPFLLNLLTTGPVVVEQQKAYVGGKSIDNRGGNIVDFLLRNSVGGNVGLLEIKTPKTPLLAATEYRSGIYPASSALAGAVVQVAGYRDTLLKEYHVVAESSELNAFTPLCIVLAGTHEEELDTTAKRRSFELFRASFSGVAVITYDELFARVSSLLTTLEG